MWAVWVDLNKGRHIPPRLLPLRKAASVLLFLGVDTPKGVWILLWGCGFSHGGVDTPVGVWILPWVYHHCSHSALSDEEPIFEH